VLSDHASLHGLEFDVLAASTRSETAAAFGQTLKLEQKRQGSSARRRRSRPRSKPAGEESRLGKPLPARVASTNSGGHDPIRAVSHGPTVVHPPGWTTTAQAFDSSLFNLLLKTFNVNSI
jgi:hypothetical protein